MTHRACIFFATVGASILREHYNLPATISAGKMAIMVDDDQAHVAVYGREENGTYVNDERAFHAWVECDGWLIDFMAPIMGIALREDSVDWKVPRRMLQKPMSEGKRSLAEIQRVGEFFARHDDVLAESLIESQGSQFLDLRHVCLTWYRRPPKALNAISLADSHGPTKQLILRAPSIDGVW